MHLPPNYFDKFSSNGVYVVVEMKDAQISETTANVPVMKDSIKVIGVYDTKLEAQQNAGLNRKVFGPVPFNSTTSRPVAPGPHFPNPDVPQYPPSGTDIPNPMGVKPKFDFTDIGPKN